MLWLFYQQFRSTFFFYVTKCFSSYSIISSKLSNVTFKYMDGINGESDIHECEINEVCNVIHNRFWVSSLTERLCRCPNGKECPWQWKEQLGNWSLSLNNKSHMEFCTPVTEMDVCKYENEGIKVYGKSNKNNSYLIPYNVTLSCTCPQSYYWRLKKYVYEENDFITQTFKCIKERMCYTHEFCGYIRSDLYSTYYRCTCPENHLCIFNNRTSENVQELLYSGPAYKAHCLPFKRL
ncbi:U-scoloptoxin(11)-Sm2a-like isoform X2 [Hylaeus volcanicus]|uniref:U-scoloptoxin(11)-Sm2a-like isoform X2 n=1 Tax=Hylaeus volcanicus TaxID=313075 RepID=UPI0023B7CDFF|nr:U-scoloptoxin(11)-Sm2a-like isoform X2 [Hylaeus volcanicus]